MPVDPCFAELLADRRTELRRLSPKTTLADLRMAANRFQSEAVGPELAVVEEVVLSGAHGRPMAGRCYRPVHADRLPGILYCHGGGFVFGNLDTHDAICRLLARASGCVVIAFDYRLAPEHPFPAAIDDGLAALWHINRFPAEFGVTPGAMAIAGDSAGGYIAVRTAAAAAPLGLRLHHLGLLYPVVEPQCDSPSMLACERGYMLTREAMQWFWECFLPTVAQRQDPRLSLLAIDPAVLPPSTVILAEFDPLQDEGRRLAGHFAATGRAVDVHCFPAMIHGFAGMPQRTTRAIEAIDLLGEAIRRSLEATGGDAHR